MNKKPTACTDAEFVKLFNENGATKTAEILGVTERNVYRRRRRLEKNLDTPVNPPSVIEARASALYPARIPFAVRDGIVLVGSDPHFWPDIISPAYRALLVLIREFGPDLRGVILNGDLLDGARISRHPPIGWPKGPTVRQEKEVVDERLTAIEDEIRKAAREADLFWLLGNHDYRFESRLASQAPEYEGVGGFTLADQFPAWRIGVSLWLNDDVVVKHRFKGGIHATHNNALWAGRTMITGHLHSLKVTPFNDYDGLTADLYSVGKTRYGVDTGTLASPYGDQFAYGEDNPLNHRSGLIVLTFRNGRLLWPETVRVFDPTTVEFRGRLISV